MDEIEQQYLQKPDETFMDWKIRLIVDKLEKNIDIDWTEMVNLLGIGCSSSHLRKVSYGIYEAWQYFQEKLEDKVEDNEILNKLEQKKIAIELERKKKQAIGVEYNKILREEARRELFFDEIKKSILSISPPEFKEIQNPKGNIAAILGWADAHCGKEFQSLTNKYNSEIFINRMSDLQGQTIDICNKEKIGHLNVLNLGDSVEGMIRISQLRSIEMGFMDSVIFFCRTIVEWLNELSKYVEVTYHHVRSSNHTEIRPFNTKAGQFPMEDLERIIIMYIHDMLKDNPRVIIPEYKHDFVSFDVVGYKVMAKHGHKIKNIREAIKSLSMLHRTFIDYLLMAHYHHGEDITVHEGDTNNCKVIAVPSIMGSDSLSDTMMVGSKPGASLLVFEEGKGKTIGYDITL